MYGSTCNNKTPYVVHRAVIRAVTRRPAPQLEGLLPPLLEEESDSTPYCDTPPLSEEDAVGMTVNNDPQHEQMEEGNLDTPPPPLPPPSCQNSCPAPVDGDTKRGTVAEAEQLYLGPRGKTLTRPLTYPAKVIIRPPPPIREGPGPRGKCAARPAYSSSPAACH